MRRITLLAISLSLFHLAFAQKEKAFTFTSKGYLIELEAFFKQDRTVTKENSKEFDQLYKQYADLWGKTPLAAQEKIANLSNLLTKAKASANPVFYQFFKAQIELSKRINFLNNIESWVSACELSFSERKKLSDFNAFISNSLLLFQKNYLYESKTSVWEYPKSAEFDFQVAEKEIYVVFKKAFDLVYSSQTDAGTLYQTTGRYAMRENKWEGVGGQIDWSRTGLPDTKCFAKLGSYEASVKFPKYTADSVLLVHTDYFSTPMLGRLEEQVAGRTEADKYTYPRFRSYTKEFVIKNMFPDVDYIGSFMMNGSRFLTSGEGNQSSHILFYRNGKEFLRVESPSFLIDNNRLYSKSAGITIFIGDDSITNVGVEVNYNKAAKELRINNPENRNFNSPFENSYHRIDIYCENILWKIDEDKLFFSNTGLLNSFNSIVLESSNYFSNERYKSIQGIDEISPLQRVNRLCSEKKTTSFSLDEFTRYVKMDRLQAKLMIHNLSKFGLVIFDDHEEKIIVRDKLFKYAKAYSKTTDYDVIKLLSEVESGPNASLDLTSNELGVNGIKNISVSDSQNVLIQPAEARIVMTKNRDIRFSGQITVGRFDMFIQECVFNYDSFKIVLPHIDSLSFYTSSFSDPNQLVLVKTKLNNLSGEIAIDKAFNKASLKKFKDYPIFKSTGESFAYYDSPEIQKGNYAKDRFYYKLDPFIIKDMMRFQPDSIWFSGELYSAGIFPTIKEPLKVQKDYSLGFITNTGKSGLPIYGGKGTYYEVVDLSNKGLLGRGSISYLSSMTESKTIVFMPDSLESTNDTFSVKSSATFADASIKKCSTHWYPYQDQMYVFNADDPFKLYRGESTLHGNLLLEPAGMSGSGRSNIGEMELYSKQYTFHGDEMASTSSDLKLRSSDGQDVLLSQNIQSNINFKSRLGKFRSTEIEKTSLPVMQYLAYIDQFDWNMDKKEVVLSNSKSLSDADVASASLESLVEKEMPGALFVSTHPDQDSLQFHALTAVFNYDKQELTPNQVYALRIADVLIAPGDHKLSIKRNAMMDTLNNCSLLADLTHQYHRIYSAQVKITSQNSFGGTGYIDYIDQNKKKQKIFLAEIATNANKNTVAKGKIESKDLFFLSDAFAFSGEVYVNMDEELYTFSGGVQLQHNCRAEGEALPFTRFKSMLNPDSLYIPIAEVPEDIHGERVTASILFDKNTLAPYSAFLTNDKEVDNELIGANGLLSYNAAQKTYVIGSEEKIEDPENAVGNYLRMNKENCDVRAEGRIDFQIDEEFVKLQNYGSIETNNTKVETKINTTFGFNFPFSNAAIDFMGREIFDDLGLSPMDLNDENLRKAFCEYYGVEKGNSSFNEFVGYGEFPKVPKEFQYTLFFNNVKLNYSPELGYHFNGMAGLGIVGKYQLHKLVRTKIQLAKYRNTVLLKIYIEVNPDHWYYFNYDCTNRRMRALSSMDDFENAVRQEKTDSKTIKGKSGKTYSYGLGVSKNEALNFKKAMEGIQGFSDEENEDGDTEDIEDTTE